MIFKERTGRFADWLSRRKIASSHSPVVFWFALATAVLGIKIALLLVDPLPLFFLGDSGVYLDSAISSSMPNDRSFTYGLTFIRPLLAVFGTLYAVVVAQSLLASATALLAAACLRIGFCAPLWATAAAALVYAIEPLALIHERLVMTETLTLVFFALFVLAGLAYISHPRASLLSLLAVLGTCVLSLRTFFIPVLLVATAAAVILGAPRLKAESGSAKLFRSRFLRHALVAIVATLLCHAVYKTGFSYVTKRPPAYNSAAGLFLLASWAPIITADDFPNEIMAAHVLPKLEFDLRNRAVRPNQRYSKGGLVELLLDDTGRHYNKANALALETAVHAGRRNPVGVAGLAWDTYTDFWDRDKMANSILVDQGQLELNQSLLDYFRSTYAEDLSRHHLQDTPVKRWHRVNTFWYRLLLLSPAFAVVLVLRRRFRAQAIFIGVIVWAVMVVACALVTEPTLRYLHALAWLTCIQLGMALGIAQDFLDTYSRKFRAAGPSNQAAPS
jgi:hypothetical protein